MRFVRDVFEMVCDRMAAAKRNPDDGVKLAYNVELFGIDKQLASILARDPEDGD